MLPDTYSIQTWVWDAKTKLGLLEGGNREGGWRLTENGAKWIDSNPEIVSYVRAAVLDESEYSGAPAPQLVLLSLIPGRAIARPWLVVDVFRRFPASFGVAPDRHWPDAAIVDDAVSAAVDANWIVVGPQGLALTAAGAETRAATERALVLHQDGSTSRRRSIASQYVEKVEATAAYRTYLDTGDADAGAEVELYRLIRCPPNAGTALVVASIAELLENLARAGRSDLEQFIRLWARRSIPEVNASRVISGGDR
jgi:hypothetical protein